MDFPINQTLLVDCSHSSFAALERLKAIESLMTFVGENGFVTRSSINLVVDEEGNVCCKAVQFIPAKKHIIHIPYNLSLSLMALKLELCPDKNWDGWADLKQRIKQFDGAYVWSERSIDKKDYFLKNVTIVVCIIGLLNKISAGGTESVVLKTFRLYWDAVSPNTGSVFYNWTTDEIEVLQETSFYECIHDTKQYGEALYINVVQPFTHKNMTIFGPCVTFQEYLRIFAIVSARSNNIERNSKSCLLPVIDFINGKPNDQHNVILENCAIQRDIQGEFIKYYVLETCCDINAGDEILLEYAQIGNSDYLLTYNHIPLDPEVIMNNKRSEVYVDIAEFLDTELLRMHPNVPFMRKLKKNHVYGSLKLPKMIAVNMEDLFSSEYSCIPTIHQVLMFLQFNEEETNRAIKSSRIKLQMNPQQLHKLFLMFISFIESNISKPDMDRYMSLLQILDGGGNNGNSNSSTNKLRNSLKGIAANSSTKKQSSNSNNSKDKDNNSNTSSNSSNNKDQSKLDKEKFTQQLHEHQQHIKKITENMKSAIYLQMSEHLVLEVMINRFINLFPDSFHELGYSMMRSHLVSNEINSILLELLRPSLNYRITHCMMCGSGGSMSKCSRCRKVFYCSAKCQRDNWVYHKKVCKPTSASTSSNTINTSTNTNTGSGDNNNNSSTKDGVGGGNSNTTKDKDKKATTTKSTSSGSGGGGDSSANSPTAGKVSSSSTNNTSNNSNNANNNTKGKDGSGIKTATASNNNKAHS